MKADRLTEAEVTEVLNRFLETYSRRDVEGTLALLAPDPDLLIIGTGVDEKISGIQKARIQLKRDYAQADEISIKLGPVAVSAAGTVAWLAADSTWKVKIDEKYVDYQFRWTLVMEKRQSKWLIVQSHLSAPAQSQAGGQSFPSK
jgi:ketosteroid isomerase-like protein